MVEIERCKDCGKFAVFGEMITIPASEYEALKKASIELKTRRSISSYRAVSRSGIGLNPELAEFILENIGTMTVTAIHAACVRQFRDRAPSRSSIYRFIDKMRTIGKE